MLINTYNNEFVENDKKWCEKNDKMWKKRTTWKRLSEVLMYTTIINISVIRVIICFSFHNFCHKMLELLGAFKLCKWGFKWWSFVYLCGFFGNGTWRWAVGFWLNSIFICLQNLNTRYFLWIFSFSDWVLSIESVTEFFFTLLILELEVVWGAYWGTWLLWSRL